MKKISKLKVETGGGNVNAVSDDVFAKLGDNAAAVLKVHVQKVEQDQAAIEAIRKRMREHVAAAKKDGFESWLIKQIVKERKMDTGLRVQRQDALEKARKALDMPDLFEFSKNKDAYSSTEADADQEAAA